MSRNQIFAALMGLALATLALPGQALGQSTGYPAVDAAIDVLEGHGYPIPSDVSVKVEPGHIPNLGSQGSAYKKDPSINPSSTAGTIYLDPSRMRARNPGLFEDADPLELGGIIAVMLYHERLHITTDPLDASTCAEWIHSPQTHNYLCFLIFYILSLNENADISNLCAYQALLLAAHPSHGQPDWKHDQMWVEAGCVATHGGASPPRPTKCRECEDLGY